MRRYALPFAATGPAMLAPEPDPPAVRALVELVEMLEDRQPELHAHGARVAEHASAIAHELGLPVPAIARVQLAARLHDIGKIWISDEVLAKPGPLDENEWELIQLHPESGARLLRSAQLNELADIVVAHHERPDACGYPEGVPAARTPLEAQIVATADAYDAMVSPRPYQRTLTPAEARAELARVAGTQLDSAVVAAFLRVLASQPDVG